MKKLPKLLSATVIMGSGTLVSRILGMARVFLAANLLGMSSRQGTAFTIATSVPNSLYLLLAGGALNSVLVPQIVRAVRNDPDKGEAYTNRIMTAFLLIVAGLTVILVVGTPVLTVIYSDSGWRAPQMAGQYQSLEFLMALCLVQVFFYGMFFLGGQVLNARGSFGPMMWAPAANNVVQIIMLGVYAGIWGFHTDTSAPFTTPQVLLLGIGSLVGIACQAVLLWAFMKKVGFKFHPRFDLKGTGLSHTFSVAKWTLGLVALNQLGGWIFTKIGSSAVAESMTGAGNSVYQTAALVALVPHSLFTISVATALFPRQSRLSADQQQDGLMQSLDKMTRYVYVAIVPISLLFMTVGIPIGNLVASPDKGGTLMGWTLMVLGLHLFPYTMSYLVARVFYAAEDTRSAFFAQLVFEIIRFSFVFIIFILIGVGPNWVAPCLAICFAAACFGQAIWSMYRVRRIIPSMRFRPLIGYIGRILIAALPGAVLAWVVCWYQTSHWSGFVMNLAGLVVAVLAAAGAFIGLGKLLHIKEITEILGVLRRSRGQVQPEEPDQPEAM